MTPNEENLEQVDIITYLIKPVFLNLVSPFTGVYYRQWCQQHRNQDGSWRRAAYYLERVSLI